MSDDRPDHALLHFSNQWELDAPFLVCKWRRESQHVYSAHDVFSHNSRCGMPHSVVINPWLQLRSILNRAITP